MARIPKEELERLRSLPIRELVEGSCMELKPRGKDLAGLCPLHDDHDASLIVTEQKNVWHCFGCQAGGGVIDWVMAREGLSFRAATEWLLERYPSLAGDATAPSARVTELAQALWSSMSDQELLHGVVTYYEAVLLETREALAYLNERGISRQLIETHRLGYCDRTLSYRLKENERDALRARLTELGVIRSTGHEHLVGCLVVPTFSVDGKVGELYGRRISKKLSSKTSKHLYLPGPHRGVFNAQWLTSSKTVVLCESFLDALSFLTAGIRCVTSSFGVEGLTEELITALCAADPERVVIAYDADDAGNTGAAKAVARLSKEGLACFRARFPKGMDANEYARKVQPAKKSLELVIEKAEPMGAPSMRTEPEHEPESAEPPSPEPIEVESEKFAPPTTEAENPPAKGEPPEADPAPLVADREEPPPVPPAMPTVAHPMATPIADGLIEVEEHQVAITLGDRSYRIRGLMKNLASYETLKVNILCQRKGGGFHVDTLDLYQGKPRAAFIKEAANELCDRPEVIKRDLGRVLGKLEELLERARAEEDEARVRVPEMSEKERAEAMALLTRPDLLDTVLADFESVGVVGEETNKLVAYLAATSRKLEKPLAVMIQSSSAAGKSSLMDAVLRFIPDEEKVAYSAMTGQSLFYMADVDLRHKVLAIAEEEGAEQASYALKILQSEGKLSIASTGKDPTSGRHTTHEYEVEGPVSILSTTTAIEVDEELLNRCLVLCVDESAEQTRRIHELQRQSRTREGLFVRLERKKLRALHQNAQRLLEPLFVVNPYASELSFSSHKTRARRDHEKYLTLIETIALLHQHQREVKTERHGEEVVSFIEVTREDIARADALMSALGGDAALELPPQTCVFLEKLKGFVDETAQAQGMSVAEVRFTRRQAIEHTGVSLTAARKHLERLLETEIVVAHHGRQGRTFFYELALQGPTWRNFAPPDGNFAPPDGDFAPPSHPGGTRSASASHSSGGVEKPGNINGLGSSSPHPIASAVPRARNGASHLLQLRNGAGHV